jgi:hypothetical protein
MAEEQAENQNEWIDGLTGSRDAEVDEEVADAQERNAAAEEPEPKQEEVQQKESQEEKESGKVPVSVLTSERDKYQARIGALEGTIAQQGQAINKFQEMQDQIRELRAAKDAKPAEPEPDYLEDPKGYIDQKLGTTLDQLRNVEQTVQQTTETIGAQGQALNQQNQIQAIQRMAAAGEESFVKDHPDYWEALEYAREKRADQLRLAFPDADNAQLAEHIRSEEFATAAQILQQNRNPAEFAYNYAASLGYTSGNKEDALSKLGGELETNKQDAQGLGSPGTSSELDSLLNSSPDEFEQALKEAFL